MTTGHGDAFGTASASVDPATAAFVAILLVASGVLPFLVGVVAARAAVMRSPTAGAIAAAASSVGIAAFLLFDFLKEGADLGQGTGRPVLIAGLAAAFAAGAVGPVLVRRAGTAWAGGVLAWAAASGLHGLGEGLLVTTDVAQGTFVFSLTQGASFGLHKGLEGFVLGTLLLGTPTARAHAGPLAIALVPLVLAPPIAAVAPALLAAHCFAAAAGAALVAIVALAWRTSRDGSVPASTAVWAALGALAVFGAGLLHQF